MTCICFYFSGGCCMKKRIFAVLLSLALAGTFAACGGSKEGAETETVADQSISDLSVAGTVSGTESTTQSTASASVTPAAADESTVQPGGTDIITPIPAVNLTDGTQTVQAIPAEGTTAENGTSADDSSSPKTMIVTADINVREEADIEADILGGYEEGDEITVIGSQGDWYIVEYNGETGYVNSNYVVMPETPSSSTGDESTASDSVNSEYGKLVDGDGDPVDLRYYDGSYEIYDEDGNRVYIDGLND
ncbi:MAG TPA: hypothetical protein DCG37_08400 [Lachnospiraceae bacterium]|nr:hypothetical protein [Lachnospiraceae bacterium]